MDIPIGLRFTCFFILVCFHRAWSLRCDFRVHNSPRLLYSCFFSTQKRTSKIIPLFHNCHPHLRTHSGKIPHPTFIPLYTPLAAATIQISTPATPPPYTSPIISSFIPMSEQLPPSPIPLSIPIFPQFWCTSMSKCWGTKRHHKNGWKELSRNWLADPQVNTRRSRAMRAQDYCRLWIIFQRYHQQMQAARAEAP